MSDVRRRRLQARARAVGALIGCRLQLREAPNPDHVGLTAGTYDVFVLGPYRLQDGAAEECDRVLDALERGDLVICWPDDGFPRLLG